MFAYQYDTKLSLLSQVRLYLAESRQCSRVDAADDINTRQEEDVKRLRVPRAKSGYGNEIVLIIMSM